MSIAKIILEQLGGNKFIAMTGAKNFVDTGNGLLMKLPENDSKATHLQITLNKFDTYDLKFYRLIKRRFEPIEMKLIIEYKDIYVNQLRKIFKEVTGMDTSLEISGIYR